VPVIYGGIPASAPLNPTELLASAGNWLASSAACRQPAAVHYFFLFPVMLLSGCLVSRHERISLVFC